MYSLKRMFKRRGGKSKSKRIRRSRRSINRTKKRKGKERKQRAGSIDTVQSINQHDEEAIDEGDVSNQETLNPIRTEEDTSKKSAGNSNDSGFVTASSKDVEEDIDLSNEVANELAEGEEENNYITPLSYADLAPYNLPGGSRRRRRRMRKQRKTKKVKR